MAVPANGVDSVSSLDLSSLGRLSPYLAYLNPRNLISLVSQALSLNNGPPESEQNHTQVAQNYNYAFHLIQAIHANNPNLAVAQIYLANQQGQFNSPSSLAPARASRISG